MGDDIMRDSESERKESAAGAGASSPAARIGLEQFQKVELRVATVRSAEKISGSRKLLQLSVDLGSEQRTLVAGIALVYEPEALVGRQVIVVANLEPANLMGVQSDGMVLAADAAGRPILAGFADPVPNGARVR
ncbi:MAG TPA: methionine--tRNA ligase subunit beta [Acidobacteriota bacterium]